ncbi:S-adenosyl-L-methionine-dependent methyltransferase [Pyronema domesticum]|nr:S-adenosyl-L-methionine-dependent methyltransferase [Pyronema domesticum]
MEKHTTTEHDLNEEEIEVDPAVLANTLDEDYDSAGYATTTESLSSSINEYIFENGRRYHSYFGVDKNLMPTDEKEQDRLDLHHEIMLRLLDGKITLAPLDHPQKILDLGTGTGIWAIDAADNYPEATVIGTDLSPIQPGWVPPNCKFEVDDAEQNWTYPADSFDFIHSRNLAQAISDWDNVMKEIYRCTKPGGYVELAELGADLFSDDNTLQDDNGFKIYLQYLNKALVMMKRPQMNADSLRARLEDAGFVDINVTNVKQPYGPWAKDRRMKNVGAMVLLMNDSGLMEAYGMAAFTRVLGMEQDEALKICKDAQAAIRNKNFHMYTYLFVPTPLTSNP